MIAVSKKKKKKRKKEKEKKNDLSFALDTYVERVQALSFPKS